MTKTIQRKLANALTVAELIEELKAFPDDCKVIFGCDYGDHCHIEQALPVSAVDSIDDFEHLVESGYSRSGVAVEENEGEDSDDCDYVILR